jgi:glucose/mannose transport system substrate-binding protein
VFESVALGVGGTAFYNKALVGLDEAALTGSEMRKTLEVLRRLKPYTDDKSAGRDWNQATALVITGKAGFQLMGDWAKGEFLAASQEAGRDFSCTPAPGTAHAYSFNVDSFAMFQLKSGEARKAQGYLAFLLMGQNFQEQFNLRKGSIPARLNMNLDKFDECAKLSGQDFSAMAKTGTLVPSVAHGMAVAPAVQSALRTAVSDFWNNDKTTVNDTLARLALAARATVK